MEGRATEPQPDTNTGQVDIADEFGLAGLRATRCRQHRRKKCVLLGLAERGFVDGLHCSYPAACLRRRVTRQSRSLNHRRQETMPRRYRMKSGIMAMTAVPVRSWANRKNSATINRQRSTTAG